MNTSDVISTKQELSTHSLAASVQPSLSPSQPILTEDSEEHSDTDEDIITPNPIVVLRTTHTSVRFDPPDTDKDNANADAGIVDAASSSSDSTRGTPIESQNDHSHDNGETAHAATKPSKGQTSKRLDPSNKEPGRFPGVPKYHSSASSTYSGESH